VKVSSTEEEKKESVKAAPSLKNLDEKKLSIKFSGEDEQSIVCYYILQAALLLNLGWI